MAVVGTEHLLERELDADVGVSGCCCLAVLGYELLAGARYFSASTRVASAANRVAPMCQFLADAPLVQGLWG